MKKIYFLSLLMFPVLCFAQVTKQSGIAPCCSVIARDLKNNIVIARDNTSGRLWVFKADEDDIRNIRNGNSVAISTDLINVSMPEGSGRSFKLIEPDKAEPAGIMDVLQVDKAEPAGYTQGVIKRIQMDPIAPCCGIVELQTNEASPQIMVPKEVAATLKMGQPVLISAGKDFAILQSTYGSRSSQSTSFGYSIKEGRELGNNFTLRPAQGVNPAMGELNIDYPADVLMTFNIISPATNASMKYITSPGEPVSIPAGIYTIQVNNAPMEKIRIEAGKQTRLSTGILHIPENGTWTIYHETKKDYYRAGTTPRKVLLPVADYRVVFNNNTFKVKIQEDIVFVLGEKVKDPIKSGTQPGKYNPSQGKAKPSSGKGRQR